MGNSVKMRQYVEREIAKAFIKDALAAGYTINIDNGGDEMELAEPSGDAEVILKAMFASDEDRLWLYKGDRRKGWCLFVYGNSGWDVIGDYTCNLEPIMGGANAESKKWE